ncbi:flagellar basal body rod protein FlgC [Tabrizicola fusiformis]|uniref:flagellar basal body rod protein FlgC n=1 Tax=Tabrizicola sp. SY72 TaxID=2741673 RepID=UPI001571FC97|nr:flagellar basal body rod protein FlgC [Tabrizicola sp. SY72]NTT86679.1 flagellar basal body rod protein FlgC [Tabrizicola sp. SY72]
MSDLLKALSYSASGMEAQAMRLRHVSENISNADTPGYHRKLVSFAEEVGSGEVRAGKVRLDQSPLQDIYDPGHPLADETGHHDGSNVDLVIEIADAREAQRSYEANLRLFDQARQMTAGLFELLRK